MALMEIKCVSDRGGDVHSASMWPKPLRRWKENPGIDYERTSMGTIMRGDVDRLLEVALKLHNAVLATGAKRISTTIKIDDRLDKEITLSSKMTSLKERAGGTGLNSSGSSCQQ